MSASFEPRLDVLPAAQRRLWRELADVPEGFVLYGGTALALRLGQRASVDFDFFTSRRIPSGSGRSRLRSSCACCWPETAGCAGRCWTCACLPRACSGETIFEDLRGRCGKPYGQCASVTATQLAGDSLNVHPHWHALLADGVYASLPGQPGSDFVEAPRLGDEDVLRVTKRIAERAQALLDRRLPEGAQRAEGAVERLREASLRGVASLGERAGKRTRRRGGVLDRLGMSGDPSSAPNAGKPPSTGRPAVCALVEGWSVHAGTRVERQNRLGLERLARYVLRGPLAASRLEELPDGRLAYHLAHPLRDGSTTLVMEPLELLEKLAALVPRTGEHRAASSFAGPDCFPWCTGSSRRAARRGHPAAPGGREEHAHGRRAGAEAYRVGGALAPGVRDPDPRLRIQQSWRLRAAAGVGACSGCSTRARPPGAFWRRWGCRLKFRRWGLAVQWTAACPHEDRRRASWGSDRRRPRSSSAQPPACWTSASRTPPEPPPRFPNCHRFPAAARLAAQQGTRVPSRAWRADGHRPGSSRVPPAGAAESAQRRRKQVASALVV